MRSWEGRIGADPEVMLGKAVIAGTRIPLEHILRKLASGMTVAEVLCDHSTLCEEDILAALA
jgi:uncharacterized protein (DUF433 family)